MRFHKDVRGYRPPGRNASWDGKVKGSIPVFVCPVDGCCCVQMIRFTPVIIPTWRHVACPGIRHECDNSRFKMTSPLVEGYPCDNLHATGGGGEGESYHTRANLFCGCLLKVSDDGNPTPLPSPTPLYSCTWLVLQNCFTHIVWHVFPSLP